MERQFLRSHFRDGRILGAQIVGREGVDKRIDVLATAMQAGLRVADLQRLELAYAPPFSSAKDPVNFAGYVAADVLAGETRPVYADAVPEGALVKPKDPLEYFRKLRFHQSVTSASDYGLDA